MTTLKNWKNINCMHMHADNIFMCGKYNSWINLNDVVGGKNTLRSLTQSNQTSRV